MQNVFCKPLRAGNIRQSAIEDFFHQRIAARNDIADDVDIRIKPGLLRRKALDQFDSLCLKLRTHRRIDIGVAACHLVAGSFRQHRDTAHESTADAKNMNMHVQIKVLDKIILANY